IAASADDELGAIAGHTARALWPESPPLRTANEEETMDPAVIERIFFLEGTQGFTGCDVDDLVALANVAKERELGEGDAVFFEGDEGDAVFLVVEGGVDLQRDDRRLLSVGPRGCFGETCLLEGGRRPATARAAKPGTRLLVLDRLVLLELIADRPELLRSLFATAAAHLDALIGGPAEDDAPRKLVAEVG
ncbi:MAG TPA: cyclic nucleotide-binding domain-containing protein, partial [Vulgatibacter sp.]